jgi:ABC-type multidrug transport system ATPase subunit
MATPALELRGLTKRYDDTQTGWRRSSTGGLLALDAVDLGVRNGEFFGLCSAPTAPGVDFELRLELWRYIRRLHAEGTTILLTTHYLEEAEELCEDIALIRGGRVIARDTADGLRASFDADSLADVYVKAMASAPAHG